MTIFNLAMNPGVVIIDGKGYGDLGVIRALGGAGIDVYYLSDRYWPPESASRYVTKTIPFPARSESEETLAARLIEIGLSFEAPPVFLATGDWSLMFFSRNRSRFEPYFRHDLCPYLLLESIYDKVLFAKLSTTFNLPTPRSITPDSLEQLAEQSLRLTFPVVVKPADKFKIGHHSLEIKKVMRGNIKALYIESREELLEVGQELYRPSELSYVIQEYIPGTDRDNYAYHAYIGKDGGLVSEIVVQKIRCYPNYFGFGSMAETVDDPSIVEKGRECLTRLGYTGKGFVQFKKDPRNGEPYVIEINCRYAASYYLQFVAGMNIPRTAYRSILGQPVEKESPTIGVRWVHVRNDFKALLDYRKLGEWKVLSWFHSYRKVRGLAVWSIVDPFPGLIWFVRYMRMMFGKVIRRLILRRN
jgi:predicted ATP-grasp superfamily ATP-dependent carboligase